MTTDLGSSSTTDPSAATEAAVQRIRDLNEQFIESAKAAGNASLDAYEKAMQSLVDFAERAAGASHIDWVASVTAAQAKFLQDVTAAYVSAARESLQ
jgi:hypothetical protein